MHFPKSAKLSEMKTIIAPFLGETVGIGLTVP